jgi:hypothetical protein
MDELDRRRVRAAQNQSVFRAVNERINELAEQWAATTPPMFVCECFKDDCAEHVPIPLDRYEQVRQEPTRFVVLPGHEDLDVEVVVDKTDRYLVVRKIGAGAGVAAAEDPRGATAD